MTRAHERRGWRAHLPLAGRVVTLLLVVAAGWLLVRQLRDIEWPAVVAGLRAFTPATLAVAAALAFASHALYASVELIGRHLTQHTLPRRRVLLIGAVSYAFNLNLGSLVGGVAARLRLYTNAGLGLTRATQLIGISVVTNWLGYAALAGVLLTWRPPVLPQDWGLGAAELRWLGPALVALALAYLVACAVAPGRQWSWRGHVLVTPSARVAVLQLGVSMLNWATIATLVWWILQRPVDWPSVAMVFLVAAVAGVLVHVPAGLGVLEAVFLALLSHRVPAAQLLAGLIVYRVVYYLVPLAIAAPAMLWLERHPRGAAGAAPVTGSRRAASPDAPRAAPR